MRVAILGRGRLGRSLLQLLPDLGIETVGWSRPAPLPDADVYWICVPDRFIPEVAALLPKERIALHSAGSLGTEALLPVLHRAVLHPLMTFPGPEKGLPNLSGVPATLIGEGPAREVAERLGQALGLRLLAIQGDRRRYHAAATIASSHVAAVFLSAAKLLEPLGLSAADARDALLPLATESLQRARAGAGALTGPTVRGDQQTESAHLNALSGEEAARYAEIRALILKLLEEETDGKDTLDEETVVGTKPDAIF